MTRALSLLLAACAGGRAVEEVGAIGEPLLAVEAHMILSDGANAQVFQFSDGANPMEAASTASDGGTIIGTTAVDWVEAVTPSSSAA